LLKKTRSILDELDTMSSFKDRSHVIEARAANIIQGAINLINYIKENYDEETAADLERRLLNSIKGQDTSKFTRGIRRVKDED